MNLCTNIQYMILKIKIIWRIMIVKKFKYRR